MNLQYLKCLIIQKYLMNLSYLRCLKLQIDHYYQQYLLNLMNLMNLMNLKFYLHPMIQLNLKFLSCRLNLKYQM
jgi:hypothetical protein